MRKFLTPLIVALTVSVFGGVSLVGAAVDSGDKPVFVQLNPAERILDTREAVDITSGAPIGGGQTILLQVAGVSGIPADATAVQLNVTVDQGTDSSFLTVWDEGVWPGTSNLNWDSPAPRPNAVTTAIGADGNIRIFNNVGTVHAIVDVTGYYVDHNHDDRYYTQAEVDTRAPASGRISLTGGAFVPDGGDIQRDGVCFYNSNDALMRHSLPLPAGAAITRIDVDWVDDSAGDDATFTVFRTDGIAVSAVGQVETAASPGRSTDTELFIADPIAILPGEVTYLAFDQDSAGSDVQICSVEVFYAAPGSATALTASAASAGTSLESGG